MKLARRVRQIVNATVDRSIAANALFSVMQSDSILYHGLITYKTNRSYIDGLSGG